MSNFQKTFGNLENLTYFCEIMNNTEKIKEALNYINDRIVFLQEDRQKRIMERLFEFGYDLQNESSVSGLREFEEEDWEGLKDITNGTVILKWSKEPKIIDGEINYEYKY